MRKNVAAAHGGAAFTSSHDDPWEALFEAALEEAGARVERYVPAMPLSRESAHYERLRRTIGAYRLVLGQPRQEDLLRYVAHEADRADGADSLTIDLSPYIARDGEGEAR